MTAYCTFSVRNPDPQSRALHAFKPDGRRLLDSHADEPRLKPAWPIMGQHHFIIWKNRKHQKSVLIFYLCFFVLVFLPMFHWPAPPSSPSPTQPNSASSWQPLHTPRLRVSSRLRKRSNSALALGLNITLAAQPVRKDKGCLNVMNHYSETQWQSMKIYLPLADPRTSA